MAKDETAEQIKGAFAGIGELILAATTRNQKQTQSKPWGAKGGIERPTVKMKKPPLLDKPEMEIDSGQPETVDERDAVTGTPTGKKIVLPPTARPTSRRDSFDSGHNNPSHTRVRPTLKLQTFPTTTQQVTPAGPQHPAYRDTTKPDGYEFYPKEKKPKKPKDKKTAAATPPTKPPSGKNSPSQPRGNSDKRGKNPSK